MTDTLQAIEEEFFSEHIKTSSTSERITVFFWDSDAIESEAIYGDAYHPGYSNILSDKGYTKFFYFSDTTNYQQDFNTMKNYEVAGDNFRLTKNLSSVRKRGIRFRITTRIKKKYLIEKLYGKKCIACGEFNTEKHLRGFNFCYQDPSLKTVQASTLFHHQTLSEIVEILRKEKGAYLCSNCHTVYDMEYYDVIDEIYDSKEVRKRIKDDYLYVRKKFKPISEVMVRSVKDPLMKTIKIRENFINFITVIHEFNKTNIDATNETISNHLGVDYSGVKSFFFKRRDFLKRYVNFFYGRPTKYSLNDKGRNLVGLFNYFSQYYRSLELGECQGCDLNTKDDCRANQPDECPLIKLGKHLHFIPRDV